MADFRNLLLEWKLGLPFHVESWIIAPPNLTYAQWNRNMPYATGVPLLEPLPAHESTYRFHQLFGNGEPNLDADEAVRRAANDIGIGSYLWLEQYIGLSPSPGVTHSRFPVARRIRPLTTS